MSNLYSVLGISKNATTSEIKKAYHKIARTSHPDVAKNDPKAANKFKEATAAYEILSDATKRKQYDAGEIDEQGKPKAPFGFGGQGFGSGFNPNGTHQFYTNMNGGQGFGGFDFADLFGGGSGFSDIFSQMRGGRSNHQTRSSSGHSEYGGQNVSYELTIPFILSATGGETSIRLNNGKNMKVKIPAGIHEGASLRLKGQGENGGDALIKIHIEPHRLFTRDEDNIHLILPITLKEAVLGSKVTIPTLTGKVALTIPANTSSGKILRLAGKGVTGKGDLLVKIEIILPDEPDENLKDFIKNWKPKSQEIRKEF
ncbi:MAG: J domain-containing protein [Alphaproteobacteria bacterium]|nr:J domain-containing protein [Alphaproteobacteria bacterium]